MRIDFQMKLKPCCDFTIAPNTHYEYICEHYTILQNRIIAINFGYMLYVIIGNMCTLFPLRSARLGKICFCARAILFSVYFSPSNRVLHAHLLPAYRFVNVSVCQERSQTRSGVVFERPHSIDDVARSHTQHPRWGMKAHPHSDRILFAVCWRYVQMSGTRT